MALPLYAEYNMTNKDGIRSITLIDEISDLRGKGKFNPSPYNALNTNFISEKTYNRDLNKLVMSSNQYNEQLDEMYINQLRSPEIKNSWQTVSGSVSGSGKVTQNNSKSNNELYEPDEYQIFALKSIRRSEPLILPYFFSKINVNFIKKSVVEYVEKHRSVKINTEQDNESLLNLMITKYYDAFDSFGVNEKCKFQEILGNLNKSVIEDYVKNVFSGIDMHNYYIKDISNLPVPLTRPTNTNIKGVNQLGFVGFFEDNHKFTKNIDAFNTRNVIPGPLNN